MFPPAVKNYNAFASEKWNDLRIIAIGDSVEHWMNGQRIISFKYHTPTWWAAFDKSKWTGFPGYCMKVPGNRNSGPILEGYIGVQGNHGGKWKLRNFRINSTASVSFAAEKPASACGTDIRASKAEAVKATFSIERSTEAVKLRLSGAKADAVSLLNLDGRVVARGKVDAGSQTASLSGWGHPGVYLIKASAAGRTVLSDKIFLQ